LFDGLADEVIPLSLRTASGDEKVAALHQAGILANAHDFGVRNTFQIYSGIKLGNERMQEHWDILFPNIAGSLAHENKLYHAKIEKQSKELDTVDVPFDIFWVGGKDAILGAG
jgi:hypothetical protein